MKYFTLRIDEVNGGVESQDTVVFSAKEGEEEQAAKNILIGWRSLGEWIDEDEQVADFGDGIEAHISKMQEIPENEFLILKKHISDLTSFSTQEYLDTLI